MAVTVATIADELGRPTPAAGDPLYRQWTQWLADALYLINKRTALLGIDPATLDADDVDYVIRQSVINHVQHPDDSTNVNVSITDAGSVSRTYKSGDGRVTIADDLWDILFPGAEDDGAFTITTAGTAPYFAQAWPL